MSALRLPLSPPPRRDTLWALWSLLEEASQLGPASPERDDSESVGTVRMALLRGLVVLTDLRMEQARGDEHALDELDDVFSDAAPPAAASQPGVDDLCFMGSMDIRTALREIDEAADRDARDAAVESAARKLRRALRAVLVLAAEGTSIPPVPAPRGELDLALSVRRRYAELRRRLRRADERTPASVLRALQYAAGAMATLAAAPEYDSLRAADRALLRSLRDRVLAWARGAREVGEGLAVLEDIHTSVDLLRAINQRQELRAHDAGLLARLPSLAGDDRWELLVRLEGLDDGLDELIVRSRVDEADDDLWQLVVRRVDELR